MRYAALLRGINVGGKSLVPMARLRACVEGAGFDDVSTYIASGNVFFSAPRRSAAALEAELERALEAEFDLPIMVFVRTPAQLAAVVAAVPKHWVGSKELRANGIFLAREIDRASIVDALPPRDGIDQAVYVKGTLLWATRVEGLTRSRLSKLPGSSIYRQVTVRNLNTTLKLAELVQA